MLHGLECVPRPASPGRLFQSVHDRIRASVSGSFVARSAPGPSPRPRPNLSSRRDAAGRIRLGRRRGVAREAHGRGESERQAYQNQLRGDEDEDGSWIHILARGKVAENSVEPGQQLQ